MSAATPSKTTAKQSAVVVPDTTVEEVSETVVSVDPSPTLSRAAIEAEIRAEIEREAQARYDARLAALEARLTAPAPQPVPQVATKPSEPILDDENSVLIHFVDDGFTIGQRVYYRGQMVRVLKDTPWLRYNNRQQVAAYGRRMYALGPWEGEGFDLDDPALTDTDRQKLAQVQEELYNL